MTTVVPLRVENDQPPQPWKTSLFTFDKFLCRAVCCSQACLATQIDEEKVEKGFPIIPRKSCLKTHGCTSGCFNKYCVTQFFIPSFSEILGGFVPFLQRRKLRERYNIVEGSTAGDAFWSAFCPAFVHAKNARETFERQTKPVTAAVVQAKSLVMPEPPPSARLLQSNVCSEKMLRM
tara:strand:+ start:1991 stop:2521 length:531 start_codon:yes stop_codon:yes gene_type:complete